MNLSPKQPFNAWVEITREMMRPDLSMVVEMWKRLGARLNEVRNCGMPLTSVAGGLRKLGSWPARVGSWGPGSIDALVIAEFPKDRPDIVPT